MFFVRCMGVFFGFASFPQICCRKIKNACIEYLCIENEYLFKFSSNLPGNTDISGLLEDPVYWFSLIFSLTRKNKGKLFHSATAILSSSFAEDFFSFREEWA